jgi:hypothetical protein
MELLHYKTQTKMTKDEILIKCESLGLIDKIGEGYFLTEKYKELLAGAAPIKLTPLLPDDTKLNLAKLMNLDTNGPEWPVQLVGSQGFDRAVNFCDLCKIPRFAPKGYPLRGMNQDSINILGNVMADKTIEPGIFIGGIKLYYKHSEMPKGIKNLLLEGIAFELYKEHIAGNLLAALTGGDSVDKSNQHWS